ncbi:MULTISPECIES: ABC transporter substrate-binding protein [unclassified Rhizobium]|uniref:ABC transporter substrate-binding protein n=1 Tax=unclassified Rhizobium TaxID=2613769 RepID=UPI0038110E2F
MSSQYPGKRRIYMAVGTVLAGLTLFGAGAHRTEAASAASTGEAANVGFNSAAPLAKLVPDAFQKKGMLTVATQPDFEPANFTPIGETGIKGYNVDLMEAMAAKLGLPVQWEKVPFDQILIGMQSKKFDAAIAGMTDRKSRQAQVDFIDYQLAGSVFMVAKGNPKGITGAPDGGCGITVGDVKGSDAQRLVDQMVAACTAKGKEATKLVLYPTGGDKILALTSGRTDAMIWPDLAMSVLQRQVGDVLDSTPIDFEPKVYLGMTFSKDEPALRDAFVAALKAIHEDGTYDQILAKWDVQVIKLDAYGVNLAKD